MALDPVVNFGKVEVSTGYDASATSIVLSSGEGAKLPQPSTDGAFNLVWHDVDNYPDPADDPNVEIVRVTARTTDTLTVTRAQEGTSATTKNTGGATYNMVNAPTKKMIDDIGNKVAVRALLTTDQSITATEALVDFDDATIDTHSAFDEANNKFVVPAGKDGLYIVSYHLDSGTTADYAQYLSSYVKVNGSYYQQIAAGKNTASPDHPVYQVGGASVLMDLVEDDEVTIHIQATNIGASDYQINSGTFGSFLTIYQL